MKKRIFLLGSTGSIGVNAVRCITHLNSLGGYDLRVTGLAAGRNYRLLARQAAVLKPKVVCINDEKGYKYLKKELKGTRICRGDELCGCISATAHDLFINGAVGSAGLMPTMAAVRRGVDIALANKETLIMAGDIVKREIRKKKVSLVPIDSEHSALQHLLNRRPTAEIRRLVITASGGPFFFKGPKNPTVKQTLAHPTWNMGRKISVDSATMMNKGLEVVEAHYLFDMPYDRIDTIIHPQSIIHSLVETVDGEFYAQLGKNDMRLPIQNAITWPVMVPNKVKRLDLWRLNNLTFHKTDHKRFPLLRLAYECGRKGGTALAAMNAANEGAVNLFLEGRISYRDIHKKVYNIVKKHDFKARPGLEHILELDAEIKNKLIRDGK